LVSAGRGIIISIHAPREGSDEGGGGHVRISRVFQSTLPVRGATQAGYYGILYTYISIHAPREGSDHNPDAIVSWHLDFNPRSP